MAPDARRPLRVFLCHASGDKPPVRDLYKRLTVEGVDAWLDKEKLLPGQDWQAEIPRAVHESDVVVVCLSNKSITKEGYVQKEIRFALDIAEEKPEGSIFLIPARLEDCPVPERLSRWQWVDLYEENGFIQLLRSLKLRAGTVGAVIEAISYEDTDREREKRLNQLYTEGLEAFYTEDWDRACRRFQAILSEQPNHRSAAEKLEEAQCQGHYVKLYTQAAEACRSENWTAAIPVLEELTQKAPNYKDAAQLLRDARKREQLAELYEEAKALHAAQKWQAVVKVFEQISILEPNYPDAEGFLASAQKEVAEFKRLADLNEQYSQGLRAMDSGNWHEARRLLENVHKSQTGFLETEKLLRKVENEISKEEEKRKQNEQIEILYEQAHGLVRSRKWRNALEKLEEIRRLDEHFPDTEGIAERAQNELDREEAEAERQNTLAALYAESVRLLKEEKYQEALDKWQEVRAIDPKYPDRQGVQRSLKKRLTAPIKPRRKIRWSGETNRLLVWSGSIFLVGILVIGGTFFLNRQYYDRFDFPVFGNDFNTRKWRINYSDEAGKTYQENGFLVLMQNGPQRGQSLGAKDFNSFDLPQNKYSYFETRLMIDRGMSNGDVGIALFTDKTYFSCNIGNSMDGLLGKKYCWREDRGSGRNYDLIVSQLADPGKWYTILIELDSSNHQLNVFFDKQKVASYKLAYNESLPIGLALGCYAPTEKGFKGYVDYVKIYGTK